MVPGIDDIFPEFLNVDVLRNDGKLYAVPFTWGTLSMVYDPAAIAQPTSWKDALKDEYKGKVAMVDDMTGLLATWAPIVTGTKTPTRITMDQLKQTIDFLIDIKKNHARTFSASYGEAVDLFARGEVVTSAIGWDAMVGFAAAKGKVLDYVVPDEGAMVFMDTLAIPKGAPNRDLAYKMIGQSISPEGQKQIADALTQAIITKAARAAGRRARTSEIYQYDNLADAVREGALLSVLADRAGGRLRHPRAEPGGISALPEGVGRQHASTALILPASAGEGDRPQGGGGSEPWRPTFRPLHHASHGPPPPSLRDVGGTLPSDDRAAAPAPRPRKIL